MKDIIAIFQMNEISPKTRADIIIKLGSALNHEYAMNWTEPVVYELVMILDPENKILKEDWFLRNAGVVNNNKAEEVF